MTYPIELTSVAIGVVTRTTDRLPDIRAPTRTICKSQLEVVETVEIVQLKKYDRRASDVPPASQQSSVESKPTERLLQLSFPHWRSPKSQTLKTKEKMFWKLSI